MITFNVPDMTCGHCQSLITDVIKEIDGDSKVGFDMKTKFVKIDSSESLERIQLAIEDTGYIVNRTNNTIEVIDNGCGIRL